MPRTVDGWKRLLATRRDASSVDTHKVILCSFKLPTHLT